MTYYAASPFSFTTFYILTVTQCNILSSYHLHYTFFHFLARCTESGEKVVVDGKIGRGNKKSNRKSFATEIDDFTVRIFLREKKCTSHLGYFQIT